MGGKQGQKRNLNLDLLRFFGVLIIMIAHADPPAFLFQLRNFGTPLLIVASALTYALIYSQRQLDPITFYRKRLPRLIIPAWIFLTIFFVFFHFAERLTNTAPHFDQQKIIDSYTFLDGIGFVWILKVYILLALITPIALKISKSEIENRIYFSALIGIYIVHEATIAIFSPMLSESRLSTIITEVLFLILPFTTLYLYGLRLGRLSNRTIFIISFCSFLGFLVYAAYLYKQFGQFIPTQSYKRPPTLYYLLYAFFCLNLVYLACKKLDLSNAKVASTVIWLSENSLWIYLWHIMAFYLWGFLFYFQLPDYFYNFVTKAIFILGFGVVVTAVQKYLVLKIVPSKHPLGKRVVSVLT